MSKMSTKVDATAAVNEYINKQDWRINANANTNYSHASLINNLAGKMIANFWLDEVYTKEEGDAHRNGDYHIHDLDCLSPYCCGHDFQKILDEGFNGVIGRVGSKPPKHFREALYQLANYFGILQAEWAGAQAVSSFDTYLAPHVFFDTQVCGLTYDDVKKAMRNFVFNLNVPSRWGQCVPSTYKCLKGDGTWANYENLKVGDEIYVVDMETGKLKKDTVAHVNVFDSPEKLHRYTDGDRFNFEVTDKHRILHQEEGGKWVLTESAELFKKTVHAKVSVSLWSPMTLEEFTEDEYEIPDHLLELLALLFIHGNLVGDNVTVYSDTVKLTDHLTYLCDELGLECKITDCGEQLVEVIFTDTDQNKMLTHYFVDARKNFYELASKLSPRQANIVVDTYSAFGGLFDGDYWQLNCGTQEEAEDGCPLKEAEFIAGLVIRTGKAVNIDDEGRVFIRKRGPKEVYGREVESRYKKVWCPTTNTGTFVCMTDEGYVLFTGNSPFTNVTIDWTVPNLMKDMAPTRGGINFFQSILNEWGENEKSKAVVEAIKQRFKEIDPESYEMLKDDESALMLSFTYRFFQKEMNIINKAFYEVLNEGDMLGQPFTFPIPTINITEDFDWDGENTDLLFENTAKYGSSYFQNFIGSQYMIDENGNKVRDPNAYTPNDVRSMCPLALNTPVITNHGIKRLDRLNEQTDKVMLHGVWYSFRKVTNIPEQRVLVITLDGQLSDGKPIQFVVGENHLQPIYNQASGSYIKRACKYLNTSDFIPVEEVYHANDGQHVRPEGNRFIIGADRLQYIQIKDIREIPNEQLMCIEVDNDEHNFTLGNGIITSNCRLQLDKKQLRLKGSGLFGSDAKTGCYDDQTEVLTKDGWKYFKDLSFSDELYTLTKERNIELHNPDKIFCYDYDGELIEFKNRSLDLLVTPNHNMPLCDSHLDNQHISWHHAEDCPKNFSLPACGEWEGKVEDEYYTIKAAPRSRSRFFYDVKVPLKLWVQFLGWFISEGSSSGSKNKNEEVCKNYRVKIDQSKTDNIKVIDEFMAKMPFKVSRECDPRRPEKVSWVIRNKSLWYDLHKLGCSYEKRIPRYIFDLSKEYLKIFFDAMIAGDGYKDPNGISRTEYFTSSPGLADDFQQLCILLGYSARIHVSDRDMHRERCIRGRKFLSTRLQYKVSVLYAFNKAVRGESKRVQYKGKVYCVEIPNHIICVRRNGKVVWCGNSIGVVTINCPRLGYLHKGDKEGLYHDLDHLIEMSKSTLEKKRKFVTEMLDRGLYPYTRRYIGSFDTYFSTIGVNGMNEMIRNFTNDEHNITDEYGQAFAKEVLDHIRAKLIEYQEETGNLYNLEATPAEGTMRRFAHSDKKKYPGIIQAGFSDSLPYYTNSSQLPVEFTEDVFTALDLQDVLQKKYTGGCTSAGNYVVTDRGPILIEDIVKNFNPEDNLQVASWNNDTKQVEWDKVVDAMAIDISKHDKIKVEGKSGFSITTSDWHPFFVLDKDDQVITKRADELVKGDKLLSEVNMLFDNKESELNQELGYLIGYFIGDGSISQFIDHRNGHVRHKIRFADTDTKMLEKVNQIIFENNLSKQKNQISFRDKRSSVLQEVSYDNDKLWQFFNEWGFSSGKKSGTVHFSDKLKANLNRETAIGILSGLIDSNGHITKAQDDIEYATISKQLADDIMWLCHLLGLKSYYRIREHAFGKTGKPSENLVYSIIISHKDFYRLEQEMCCIKKTQSIHIDHLKKDRHYTWVTNVSKVDVEDNQFYDLTTEKNHNYLCGTNRYVFIHNTVFHVYTHERVSSAESCKRLVKAILSNYRLPYISITPTFSVCPVHGRIEGEHEFCPKCDQEVIRNHAEEVDTNL